MSSRRCAALITTFLLFSPTVNAQSARTRVAAFDLTSETLTDGELHVLSGGLRDQLAATGRFDVIEAALVDSILEVRGIPSRECSAGNCGIDVGQVLGAGQIVVGSVERAGATHTIRVRLINVNTGRMSWFAAKECTCSFTVVLGGLVREVARDLAAADDEGMDPIRALAAPRRQGAVEPLGGEASSAAASRFSPPKGFAVSASALLPTGDLDTITDYGGSLSIGYAPDEEGILREGPQFDFLFWTGPLNEIAIAGNYIVASGFAVPRLNASLFARAGVGVGHRYSLSGSSPERKFSKRDLRLIDLAYRLGGGVAFGRLEVVIERQAIANWSWLSVGARYAF